MVAEAPDAQNAVVRRALEVGVNWFDTAPTYGDGRSEQVLGKALRDASIVADGAPGDPRGLATLSK